MIKADFYPTQDTWNLDNKNVELTAFLNTMEYTSDIGQQYVMGYVPYDYVPTFGRLSHVHRVDTEGAAYIEFTDAIDQDNYGWTLTADTGREDHSQTYSSAGNYTLYEYNVGGAWYKQGASSGSTSGFDAHNTRFINKMEIATQNSKPQNIRLIARAINHEPVEGKDDYYWATYITINSGDVLPDGEDEKDLYDWLYNDAVVSKSFQVSMYPHYVPTFELRASDFANGAAEFTIDYVDPDTQEVVAGRYTVKIWICGYSINQSRMIGDEDNVGGYFAPAPTYYLHSSQAGLSYFYRSTGSHSIRKNYVTTGNYDYITLRTEGLELVGGMPIEMSGEQYILGGLVGRIPASFLTNAARGAVLEQSTFIVYKRFTDSVWILRLIHPEEIKRDLEMQTKVISGDAASFGSVYGFTDETHVPYFNESDTPQWTLLTGDLEVVEDDLRPWQLNDITDNDFNWDDIPPYTPPGPGPGPGPGGEPDEGDRGKPIPKRGNVPGMTEFVHYAAMTPTAINELAVQLWDKPDSFWQKIIAATSENPMDYFISLRYYPVQFNKAGGRSEMYIGRGGQLHIANNYYPLYPVEEFNCGSIVIARQYNNFLDYAPYTRIQIFLPFAGSFELNPTIVMGRTISLWLSVDVSDGSAVWEVYNETDQQPVLVKQCRMGAEIPLSGLDASQMAANVINASLGIVQHTLGAVEGGVGNKMGVATSAINGNLGGAINQEVSGAFNGPENVLTGLTDAYNFARASKEIPQYSGGSSGAAACGINHTPYIIYRRPLCTNPENFAHAVGYLSNKTAVISTLSGFTTCRNVDVSGISQATDKEKAQIKQILESGFYA